MPRCTYSCTKQYPYIPPAPHPTSGQKQSKNLGLHVRKTTRQDKQWFFAAKIKLIQTSLLCLDLTPEWRFYKPGTGSSRNAQNFYISA